MKICQRVVQFFLKVFKHNQFYIIRVIVGEEIHRYNLSIKISNFQKPNRALFAEQLNVNTTSVVILTQKLMPLLIKASSKVSGDQLSASRAAVVTISSGLASMTDFATGGHAPNAFAYRISKAAINMFGRALANDMKDDHILVASIGPGWVKTDMGGEKALLTVSLESFKI